VGVAVANLKVEAQDKHGAKQQSRPNKLRDRKGERTAVGTRVSYTDATPGWVVAAIAAVSDAGGAIQFGYSRDGGVFTIVILLDGEIEKNYVKASEGIDSFLEGVYNDFHGDLPSDGTG
jgi:hypothetical protein